MEYTIEPATQDDIPKLAQIVLKASRGPCYSGVFDVIFPHKTDGFLIKLITKMLESENRSWVHWSNFVIARKSGEVQAGAAGWAFADQDMREPQVAIWMAGQDLDLDGDERRAAHARFKYFSLCSPPTELDVWCVEWIATLDDEGEGMSIRCGLAAIELGRSTCRVAQSNVFIGNLPDEKAQAAVGFVVTDTIEDPEFKRLTGSPGFHRIQFTY